MNNKLNHKKVWLFLGAAPTLVAIAIALFAPLDILDTIPLLEPLLGQLSDLIPSLNAYVALSSYSQVAAVFFALSWVLLPLQTAIWLLVFYRYGDFHALTTGDAPQGRAKITLAAGLVSTCVFLALFLIPKEWSVAESWGVNKSRLGLAFFGAGGFLFVATGFSFFAISVFNYFRGR